MLTPEYYTDLDEMIFLNNPTSQARQSFSCERSHRQRQLSSTDDLMNPYFPWHRHRLESLLDMYFQDIFRRPNAVID
jgi:hypothetical protein